MERMEKKIEEASISDLKTQLDKGSINKTIRPGIIGNIFASEIEYVKGNDKRADEILRQSMDLISNAKLPYGADKVEMVNEAVYSTFLSTALTEEERKQLDQMRSKYGYWQRIKNPLDFGLKAVPFKEAISDNQANSDDPVLLMYGSGGLLDDKAKTPRRVWTVNEAENDMGKTMKQAEKMWEQYGKEITMVGKLALDNKNIDLREPSNRELLVQRFVEMFGADRAGSIGIKLCSSDNKQCYKWH